MFSSNLSTYDAKQKNSTPRQNLKNYEESKKENGSKLVDDEGLQSYDCISDDLSEQKEPLADWISTKRL